MPSTEPSSRQQLIEIERRLELWVSAAGASRHQWKAVEGLRSFLLAISLVTSAMIVPAQAQVDRSGQPSPAEGLNVGSELLKWDSEGGIPTLTYGGRTVVTATNTYATPFTILDWWDDTQTNAVLLQAGVTATKDCSEIYVVESRKPGSVLSHQLGPICVGMTMSTVKRTEEGFVFADVPTPTAAAEARYWQARTGDVVTKKVEWHPRPGTTMAGFVDGARSDFAEPLENAEFFSAVARLPNLQQGRILRALWQVALGCPMCGGSAKKDLYGVVIDNRIAAFSGCGWYMNGAWLECGPTDALAVWDRERGAFYFATDVHSGDGIHQNSTALTVTPPLEEWPAVARDKLDIWQNGRPWK